VLADDTVNVGRHRRCSLAGWPAGSRLLLLAATYRTTALSDLRELSFIAMSSSSSSHLNWLLPYHFIATVLEPVVKFREVSELVVSLQPGHTNIATEK